MDLHIKTKFEVGQEVRLIYRNKHEVADFMQCTFCDGNGFFIYKGENANVQNALAVELELKKEQLLNITITFIQLNGKFLRLE